MLSLCFFSGSAQSAAEEKLVLLVVQQFFDALEKQDSAALRSIYVDGGRNFAVWEADDSLRVRYQDPSSIRFSPDKVIYERMRKPSTVVKLEGRIAMAWVPYDLWINNDFSHCGVDVFTLIKTAGRWRIASIAYTIEKENCQ